MVTRRQKGKAARRGGAGRQRYQRKLLLRCFSKKASKGSLLRCTVLEGGSRQLSVVRVSRTEWEDVVKHVLHPCFKGSKQLESFTLLGDEDGHGVALSAASAEDSWLQWPKLVRDSMHCKKEEDIFTGCVLPACKRRLAENFAEVRALPGGAARPPDRRVVLSRDPGGYAYLEFDLYGDLELTEKRNGTWGPPRGEVSGTCEQYSGGLGFLRRLACRRRSRSFVFTSACTFWWRT
jgi:hypothetical protein